MLSHNLLLTGDDGGYNLTKSLRFRNSASAYLNRTPASASNQQKWTWSGWVKLGKTENQALFAARTASSGTYTIINIDTANNVLRFVDSTTASPTCETSAYYRDYAGWYHFVVAVDTTQATSSNRIKIYTNGVLQTLSVANYPSQNANLNINSTATHLIGQQASGAYFDGYMAEVNFIDGQQLTPSSFGSTNATTGVWQPAKYTGTYGTNGFYLPFTNTTSTTTLGYDFSGNSNNWTTNNISLTAGTTYDSMTDVPTLTSATVANYCVMNPLNSYSSITVSNANLTLTLTEAAYRKSVATMAFPSTGTYYVEANLSGINYVSYGVVTPEAPLNNAVGSTATGYGAVTGSAQWDKYNNGTSSGNFWTFVAGTSATLQIAINTTSGKLWLGYDNIWLDSTGGVTGNPSAGTNPTFTIDTTRSYLPSFGGYKLDSIVINTNFGQRPFTYTPPTGFVALNTFNLPTSTIVKGNTVMNAVIWTGTGGAGSVTGVGFKPDFVWAKARSQAYSNIVFDSNRGVGKSLLTDTTGAEATNEPNGYVSSFNTDGFSSNFSAVANYYFNQSGTTYVAWNWIAGQGTNTTNTSGSITSTVSVNATAGFSVVTYTGTGSNATVGHGLGVAPSMYIVKSRSNGGTYYDWAVYHTGLGGNTQTLWLNLTNSVGTYPSYWNSTSPTSSVFSLGNDITVNQSSATYVAYCWSEIAGFSKFGSYTGNGSTDGTFIYTGFRPKFVMVKCSSNATNWWVYDSSRNTYNAVDLGLLPSLANAETSGYPLDFLSNGFKFRNSNGDFNGSGRTYIYMAFAENPFKNSLAR